MKGTLQEIVFMFARARTADQRTAALSLAARSMRFDEDQRKELGTLFTEARENSNRLVPLRPVVIASRECPDLSDLEAGGSPTLEEHVTAAIGEWIDAWNLADGLILNGIPLPGPLLLHGPTGTGKTTLTKSLVNQLKGRAACVLDAHRCVDSHLGETSARLSRAFAACEKSQSLLVIEEIDAFAEKRSDDGSSAGKESTRINVALMRLFEKANFPIVATTNRSEALDPAIIRRFEFRLQLDPLPADQRRAYLEKMLGEPATPDLLELSMSDAVRRVARIRRIKFIGKEKLA